MMNNESDIMVVSEGETQSRRIDLKRYHYDLVPTRKLLLLLVTDDTVMFIFFSFFFLSCFISYLFVHVEM